MSQLLGPLVGRAGVVVVEHFEGRVADQQVQHGVVGRELAGPVADALRPCVRAAIEVQLGEPASASTLRLSCASALSNSRSAVGGLAVADRSAGLVGQRGRGDRVAVRLAGRARRRAVRRPRVGPARRPTSETGGSETARFGDGRGGEGFVEWGCGAGRVGEEGVVTGARASEMRSRTACSAGVSGTMSDSARTTSGSHRDQLGRVEPAGGGLLGQPHQLAGRQVGARGRGLEIGVEEERLGVGVDGEL